MQPLFGSLFNWMELLSITGLIILDASLVFNSNGFFMPIVVYALYLLVLLVSASKNLRGIVSRAYRRIEVGSTKKDDYELFNIQSNAATSEDTDDEQ